MRRVTCKILPLAISIDIWWRWTCKAKALTVDSKIARHPRFCYSNVNIIGLYPTRLSCIGLYPIRPSCIGLYPIRQDPALGCILHIRPSCIEMFLIRPSCIGIYPTRPSCIGLNPIRPSCIGMYHIRPSCIGLYPIGPFCIGMYHTISWIGMYHTRPSCIGLYPIPIRPTGSEIYDYGEVWGSKGKGPSDPVKWFCLSVKISSWRHSLGAVDKAKTDIACVLLTQIS